MKVKFEAFFRGVLICLCITMFLGIWASAQTATNRTTGSITNVAPAMVRNVERWDERYLTFGLDRIESLRVTFLGEPLWKSASSLVYILLAFCAAKIIDVAAFVWLKKLAARMEGKFGDLLLAMLHGPIKVVAFVVLLHVGLNIFDWSPIAKIYFSKALILVVAGSLTYLMLKMIDLLLAIWRHRTEHEGDRK